MTNPILRGEVYSKTSILLKQYQLLLNQEFPSKGAYSLTVLIINILQKIIKRFPIYTDKQLKHIYNNFFGSVEAICGYLVESEISKVPWSIIPAIDKLFKNLMPAFEFVVVPIWESNYKILNKNILELFKTQIISINDLLFDADDKFDNNVSDFLDHYPKGIYLVFFPKIERKSALHFALLGHEIGHKYALEWTDNNFSDFLRKENLEKEFQTIFEEELKTKDINVDPGTIFGSAFVKLNTKSYIDITLRILSELTADIFGVLLFGETVLIAMYLFSVKQNIDDTMNWRNGYLSWHYRIKMVHFALERVFEKTGNNFVFKTSKWKEILEECINKPPQDNTVNQDNYLNKILSGIEEIKSKICEDIEQAIGSQLFLNFLNNKQIQKARKRIAKQITPNAYIEDEKEIPIEFRNILYSTWFELAENFAEDPQEYMNISKIINLLSIKGIELSIEQDLFYHSTE